MQKFSPEVLTSVNYEEGIILFLASGHKTSLGEDIQEAFYKWQSFSPDEKRALDKCMDKGLDQLGLSLYKSLIRGFNIWNQTQDHVGAPGWCVAESNIKHLSKQMELKFAKLFHSMDLLWLAYNENIPLREDEEMKMKLLAVEADVGISGHSKSLFLKHGEAGIPPEYSKTDKEVSCGDGELSLTNILNKSNGAFTKRGSKLYPINNKEVEDEQKGSSSSTSLLCNQEEDELDEEHILRNLKLEDLLHDPDFEKQISPILSDVEEQV